MLKTCTNPACLKLFSGSLTAMMCRVCQQLEDTAYETVKEYLVEHPGAAVMEIHEQTEVPLDTINGLYDSGRLTMIILQKCNKCGNALRDNPGNLTVCQDCAKQMQNQISSELSALQIKPPPVVNTRPTSRDSGKSYGLGRK